MPSIKKFPPIKRAQIQKARVNTSIAALDSARTRLRRAIAGRTNSTEMMRASPLVKPNTGGRGAMGVFGRGEVNFQKAVAISNRKAGGTATDRIAKSNRPAFKPSTGFGNKVATARTRIKAAKAIAARKVGGTATSRLKGRPAHAASVKANDAARLKKLSSIAKKTRSPAGIAFSIGLDEFIRFKTAKKLPRVI